MVNEQALRDLRDLRAEGIPSGRSEKKKPGKNFSRHQGIMLRALHLTN